VKVFLVPIEEIDARYTGQWRRWFAEEVQSFGYEPVVVEGDRTASDIEVGDFLDCYDTHFYKASQTMRLVELLQAGAVDDDDLVLFLDAWTPTVTALAYMRDVAGLKFKMGGFFHAGSWDTHDLLSRVNMQRWCEGIEQGYFAALDLAFVATEYHKSVIVESGRASAEKIAVTGLPVHPEFTWRSRQWSMRSYRVVFPHRLHDDKQPHLFASLRDRVEARWRGPKIEWVKTREHDFPKPRYYDLLADSRVAVSFAVAENFGIGMVEAAMLGCYPVVPDRLSYRETFPLDERYPDERDLDFVAGMVIERLQAPVGYRYDSMRWTGAISQMLRYLQKAQRC